MVGGLLPVARWGMARGLLAGGGAAMLVAMAARRPAPGDGFVRRRSSCGWCVVAAAWRGAPWRSWWSGSGLDACGSSSGQIWRAWLLRPACGPGGGQGASAPCWEVVCGGVGECWWCRGRARAGAAACACLRLAVSSGCRRVEEGLVAAWRSSTGPEVVVRCVPVEGVAGLLQWPRWPDLSAAMGVPVWI